jgi:steroid delta-isomerase-like uncharacterized protein
MAEDDLIQTARDTIGAFEKDDWTGLKRTITDDVVYNEYGTQRRVQGAEALVEAWRGWKAAFPDTKAKISDSFASGNRVTLEITWEGTQTGALPTPSGSIPASGKRHSTPSAFVLTFEGDKIKEGHMYFDMATLLQQIGAM